MSLDLEQTLSDLLPGFLHQQRWYGSRARTITACQVDDVAAFGSYSEPLLLVVRVMYAAGEPEQYALLAAKQDEATATTTKGWMLEGGASPAAVRALLTGFMGNGTVVTRRGGLLRYADLTDVAREALRDLASPVAPVGAEQSNTSVRIGKTLLLKIFRRLEPGENPELEVGRFLTTRTSFRALPRLKGSITYVSPSGSGSTLAVLQGWVDNVSDGWTYVLAQLARARSGEGVAPLAADIARLGETTASFHAALEFGAATDAFAAVPVEPRDVDEWVTHVRAEAADAFALISRQAAGWPDESRDMAARVLALAPLVTRVTVVSHPERNANMRKIRIHGDYHLGQTLKTRSGFAIIDFEGEPARPLAERRRKQCALKDVAGMLRSFDYAIDAACADRPEAARRLRQTAGMRPAFIDSYLAAAISAGMTSVPSDRRAVDDWLTLFEFEKALYELKYEINHRPDWLRIPLRAVLQTLERAADTGTGLP